MTQINQAKTILWQSYISDATCKSDINKQCNPSKRACFCTYQLMLSLKMAGSLWWLDSLSDQTSVKHFFPRLFLRAQLYSAGNTVNISWPCDSSQPPLDWALRSTEDGEKRKRRCQRMALELAGTKHRKINKNKTNSSSIATEMSQQQVKGEQRRVFIYLFIFWRGEGGLADLL